MPRMTTRRLELFMMHAIEDDTSMDYQALFTSLANVPRAQRYQQIGEQIIALPGVRIQGDPAYRTTYEGTENLFPLVLNTQSGDTRVQALQAGEVQVTATHVVADTLTRYAVVEYNHNGAKASSKE